MDNKTIAAGVGLGVLALLGIGLAVRTKGYDFTPDIINPIIDPDNPPTPEDTPDAMMNIYVMEDGVWGIVPGFASYRGGAFIEPMASWTLNGEPLGYKENLRTGVRTPIKPTCLRDEFNTIKVDLTDGIRTFSRTITPSDLKEYGIIPSNVVGGAKTAYGSGKLSGKFIYNNIGKTPECSFVSFKKTKYPENKWPPSPDGLNGFMIYGYGTGGLDYNVWTWTVCSLLEEYWRPMQTGESVRDFTGAAWRELHDSKRKVIPTACPNCGSALQYAPSGAIDFYICPTCREEWIRQRSEGAYTPDITYQFRGTSEPNPDQDLPLANFITNTALYNACTFMYGASVLWDRAAQGDGTEENPWVYDDGWQGPGWYLMLPGSQYGTAQMVTEAQKDTYF